MQVYCQCFLLEYKLHSRDDDVVYYIFGLLMMYLVTEFWPLDTITHGSH